MFHVKQKVDDLAVYSRRPQPTFLPSRQSPRASKKRPNGQVQPYRPFNLNSGSAPDALACSPAPRTPSSLTQCLIQLAADRIPATTKRSSARPRTTFSRPHIDRQMSVAADGSPSEAVQRSPCDPSRRQFVRTAPAPSYRVCIENHPGPAAPARNLRSSGRTAGPYSPRRQIAATTPLITYHA